MRRLNPDWIFLSGWGVMNQVAVKEAAAINYPMDHFIGNWWSASEADVIPAGDGAKGYKGATFHAPGTNFKVHQDIVKHVYDKGKGAGQKDKSGRGALQPRHRQRHVRASRPSAPAMAKFGNKPLTGEQVRWGFEHLNLTEQRLDQLGMKGFTHPVKVTCEDHEGNGPGADPAVGRQEVERRLRLDRADAGRRPPEARGGGDRGRQEARLHRCATARRRSRASDVVSDAARPLLSVNNIEVIYDHVILVLKGVSLQVPEEGIVALLGANGAGKSTTLKAISGLLRTERGEVTKGGVELDGEAIHRREASEVVRRGVVQVMEGRHVFEHLTVEDREPADRGLHAAERARAQARIWSGCTGTFPGCGTGVPCGPATSRGASSRCSRSGGP